MAGSGPRLCRCPVSACRTSRISGVSGPQGKSNGSVVNKRTGKAAVMKLLDGRLMDLDGDTDPRQMLVDWMVDPKNPFFARAVANRSWAHFFGRGIIEPLDDMRVTNPPSNPELLDALAKDLVDSKYSLKHLIRTICKSRTYSLSSNPNEFKQERQAGAQPLLSASVCRPRCCCSTRCAEYRQSDAVHRSAAGPARPAAGHHAAGRIVPVVLPRCVRPGRKRIEVPANASVSARPISLRHCTCSTVEEVQGKIARTGRPGRSDGQGPAVRCPEGGRVVHRGHAGPQAEREAPSATALENIEANAKNKQVAYENIVWALLNTKEFVFNR